jgi:hypothetical protein
MLKSASRQAALCRGATLAGVAQRCTLSSPLYLLIRNPRRTSWQTLIVIFMRLTNLYIVAVANAAALLLHLVDLIFLSAKLFTATACCDNSFEMVAGDGSSSYN